MINDPHISGKCDNCSKDFNDLYADYDGFYFCYNCWFLYHQYKHHRMPASKVTRNTEDKND